MRRPGAIFHYGPFLSSLDIQSSLALGAINPRRKTPKFCHSLKGWVSLRALLGTVSKKKPLPYSGIDNRFSAGQIRCLPI